MKVGKRPVRAAAATPVGIIAAVTVGLLGAAGIRDALQATDLIDGGSWSAWLAGRLEILKPAGWMLPAGVAALLIGLWFLVAALKPPRTTQWQIGETSGVWIRPKDAARLAAGTASEMNAVLSATAAAGRRKVKVTAVTTSAAGEVLEELEQAVAARLEPLAPTPRIRTRIRLEEH